MSITIPLFRKPCQFAEVLKCPGLFCLAYPRSSSSISARFSAEMSVYSPFSQSSCNSVSDVFGTGSRHSKIFCRDSLGNFTFAVFLPVSLLFFRPFFPPEPSAESPCFSSQLRKNPLQNSLEIKTLPLPASADDCSRH